MSRITQLRVLANKLHSTKKINEDDLAEINRRLSKLEHALDIRDHKEVYRQVQELAKLFIQKLP